MDISPWLIMIILVMIIVILITGWWLSWLATRLDRAHARVERTWAALDAALVRRAQQAIELAGADSVDPASTLLVCDAAGAALESDLSAEQRGLAESNLSRVLGLVNLPISEASTRAALARRLHNDAIVTVRTLRSRRIVRVFRLAGHAAMPLSFEMAESFEMADSKVQNDGPVRH